MIIISLIGGILVNIKITKNKLEYHINSYQERTGASKTWIANKLGISKQRLYSIFKADNIMIDVALKFSIFLDCDMKELFEYEVIDTE